MSLSRRWMWVSGTVLGLVLLAAIVLGGLGLWLRSGMKAELPQLDGQIAVPGLSAPVTIHRDAQGVPHIHAESLDDLFLAQGYVTAQDRLWQMDMLRRVTGGTAAEVIGPALLRHDELERTLRMRQTAEQAVDDLAPQERRFLEDYARGVNAYIQSRGGHPGAEFQLLAYQPDLWRPQDSMLVGLTLHQELSMQLWTKLAREQITRRLSPEMAADLYPTGTWRDHPPDQDSDLTHPGGAATPSGPNSEDDDESSLLRKDLPRNDLRLNDLLGLRATIAQPGCIECVAGSNDWVVSGAHSVSGKPLLANDMHLAHGIPGIWYEAQLTAGDYNVAGVTLPGLPFVIVGHNDRIAWGFTNTLADVQDVYVEETNGQGAYHALDGNWKTVEHSQEVIHVHNAKDVKFDTYATEHGPIVSPLLPHEPRSLALHWSIYDKGILSTPFFEINSAQNWQQFCAAFAMFGGPSQNVVYGDVDGHIGFHIVGKIPLRPNGLSGVPITDRSHEWAGYIPFDELPSVYDPPGGIIATANARTAPDNYKYPITLEWASAYRVERIYSLLSSKMRLAPADMLAIQTDVFSDFDRLLSQRFAYAIDHQPNPSTRLRQAADLMRRWDGTVSAESAAATIVEASRKRLWALLLTSKLDEEATLYAGAPGQAAGWDASAAALETMVSHQPARWLPKSFSSWDALMAHAVEVTIQQKGIPRDLSKWKYGAANPLEIDHPLYENLPFLKRWSGTGAVPQSGDTTTVKQVGSDFGPSERLTINFADFDHSKLNLVMGESGDPLSPYYRNQWNAWYGGTTFDFPFTDAAVIAATQHSLALVPQR